LQVSSAFVTGTFLSILEFSLFRHKAYQVLEAAAESRCRFFLALQEKSLFGGLPF
jgi:hypothetical protein